MPGTGMGDPEGLAALRQVCDQLYLLQARGSRAVLQLYPENSEQVQDQSVRKGHRQSNPTLLGALDASCSSTSALCLCPACHF